MKGLSVNSTPPGLASGAYLKYVLIRLINDGILLNFPNSFSILRFRSEISDRPERPHLGETELGFSWITPLSPAHQSQGPFFQFSPSAMPTFSIVNSELQHHRFRQFPVIDQQCACVFALAGAHGSKSVHANLRFA